jgi:hypothetical protein
MMSIDGLFIRVMDILSTVFYHSAEGGIICNRCFGKYVVALIVAYFNITHISHNLICRDQ